MANLSRIEKYKLAYNHYKEEKKANGDNDKFLSLGDYVEMVSEEHIDDMIATYRLDKRESPVQQFSNLLDQCFELFNEMNQEEYDTVINELYKSKIDAFDLKRISCNLREEASKRA